MKINALFAALLLASVAAQGQGIIEDAYNVSGVGTGFSLNSGINSGINPPTATRLVGSASGNLRYIPTSNKPTTAFAIAANKLRVTPAINPGRFTLSSDGVTPFNFASALGSTAATSQNPAVYDITISMANGTPGPDRFSFALAVEEGDATTWDFGIQVYRTSGTDNFYTIGKRIDVAASGLASDVNAYIANTSPGTAGSELHFLIRVTDAGSQTTYDSRVQVSLDGGLTWFYDTQTDSDLPNGWRLNGPGRHFVWDVAPDAGNVTYDNFSVRPMTITANLLSPANNAKGLGVTANLQAAVSNSGPGDLTVTFYGRETPVINNREDFLMVVLPDTQNYARESSGSGNATKEMWFAQTEWIITNRVQQNIAYVATLGDCVQNADRLSEWRNATNAYYRLENKNRTFLEDGIPYGVTVGNHDQDPAGDENGATTYYNQFFGAAHFQGKSYYGGHYDTNNDSWYTKFNAGGMDFLVISFEYGRFGIAIMNWAHSVMNAHPNHRVIVLTHHAGSDSTPSNHSNQGEAIYNSLRTNPNFFLMMSGHVFNGSGQGEGRRTNTFNGNSVYTLVSDYQGRFNGGNGLMRLMYFSPSNNLITVKTYSPWTGNYETDSNSQFTLPYDMNPSLPSSPGTPFTPLGTNIVAPGSTTSLSWPGLAGNKSYQWYVKVTDDFGNQTFSEIYTFATTNNAVPVVTHRLMTVPSDQPSLLTMTAFDANGDALTFQTNSQPIRGLNFDFNSTNGTITYVPARGFRGLDRFTYSATDGVATSGIANFDLSVVAPADTNNNEIADDWELQFGVSDPNADNDGDGQSNLAEYMANTNPTNATSLLQIADAALQANGVFELSWPSVGGTRYRIQFSNGDDAGGITGEFTDLFRPIGQEMDSNPHGASSTQFFTDDFTITGSATNGVRYYRVKVVP